MTDFDFSYTGPSMDSYFGTIKKLQDNGYIFRGVATPSTNPGTTTEKIAYIASEAGTYTYFGNLSVSGLSVLTYNGSAWSVTSLNINLDIQQTTGQSTTSIMSQKAVTDEFNNFVTKKKEYDATHVSNTNEFEFYNYSTNFRILFGRKTKLECAKFPVKVSVVGVPDGVAVAISTYENFSDTLNANATNAIESGDYGVTEFTFSNPQSNYLKVAFKSTASGTTPKITDNELAAIQSDVTVSISSYIKLAGTHGENYDIAVADSNLGVDEGIQMLYKNLTLESFACNWTFNANAPSGFFKARFRCAIKVPKFPVYVKVSNIPNGYQCIIQSNYTLSDVLDATVYSIEGNLTWSEGEAEYTFTNEAAQYIGIGFKIGSAGTTEFTQSDINTLMESVKTTFYPWSVAEGDIIEANNENKTIIYLNNLCRPNYSVDGRYTAGTKPLILLHFSDLHSDKINLQRIVKYKNNYSSYIDDAIGTGDLIRNTFGQSFDFWSASGADDILISTGNHEYYNGESSDYYTQITPLQVYNKYFAPFRSYWGSVVFPENAATYGYNYYYKDYTTENIRLIVLDNMANMLGQRDGVQAAWLETVLASAKAAGLHVLCAIHIGSTLENKFDNPFTSHHALFNNDGGANAGAFSEFYSLRDKVEEFINNQGVFIAWIGGHRHSDTIAILRDENNTVLKQGSIHVATASGGEFSSEIGGHGSNDNNNNGHSWWIIPKGDDCDRTDGTKQQDCFNIYSINTELKTLSIFKVGSDIDMFGRHKGSLLYDYANRTVLYSD